MKNEGRQAMKHRLITILIIGCLASALGAIPARGEESSVEQQKSFYLNCINTEIESGSCKVVLTGSRSKNLRVYGEKAALRTVFLSRNRDALVREMVAQKVSLQPQAVQQYLRQRYNEEGHVRLAVTP
jgi:hypothetical protein